MAGTSDGGGAAAGPFDRRYPSEAGIVAAHPGRTGHLPRRGAAGWVNDLAVTARAYEPLWRRHSLALLSGRATSTAAELRTMAAWLAGAIGAPTAARPLAGRRVLDVGCSAGLYARTLARAGADVVALDASRAFLRETARRAEREGLVLTLVHADAHALPFRADAFDAVAVGATLNELGDPRRALGELARVTAPGGALWLMYVRRARGAARGAQRLLELGGTRFPDPDDVERWALAAGWSPWRRATHGPVVFALLRRGADVPPVAATSPVPDRPATPGQSSSA